MSILDTVKNIAASAGKAALTTAAETGTEYAIQSLTGDSGGSKKGKRSGGIAAPTNKDAKTKWQKYEPTKINTEPTKRAKSVGDKGDKVWDEDPIKFTKDWIKSLNEGMNG